MAALASFACTRKLFSVAVAPHLHTPDGCSCLSVAPHLHAPEGCSWCFYLFLRNMPALIQDGEGRTAVFVVLLLSFVLLLIYSPGHTKMGKWKGAGISVCSYEYCRCWCKIKKVLVTVSAFLSTPSHVRQRWDGVRVRWGGGRRGCVGVRWGQVEGLSILIQLYSQKLGPNGSIGDGNFPSLFSHLCSYKMGKERGSDTRSFFTHPCSHKMGERAEWLGGGGRGRGGGLVSSLHWESAVLAQLSDSRILHRMFPSQDPSLPSQVDGSFLSFFTPPPPPTFPPPSPPPPTSLPTPVLHPQLDLF